MLRHRCPGTAGAGQGAMLCARVNPTGQPVKTLAKHLGDIREPHPVHCHMHIRQTRQFSHVRTNRRHGEDHSQGTYAPINRGISLMRYARLKEIVRPVVAVAATRLFLPSSEAQSAMRACRVQV